MDSVWGGFYRRAVFDRIGMFDIERVLVCEDLTLMEKRGLRPWGLFTMMRFRKAKAVKAAA